MKIIIKKKWINLIISCFLYWPCLIHAKNTLNKKIDTPHFSIRFSNKITPIAQHIANTLETIYVPILGPLAYNHKPICCVINHKHMVTASYFNHLTKHIQIYSLYDPNPYLTGNNDCLTLTLIHELQHTAQSLIQENHTPFWIKPLYKLFNIHCLITTPAFFKEGDAVGTETALTKSGRGRIPYWEIAYKVDILERGINTFSKQAFGSYRYPIPDCYRLGYYFTTFIHNQYGPNAINQIYQLSSQIPYIGFYYAVKKVTKKSVFQIYKNMSKALLLMWQKQVENLKITPAQSLTLKKPKDNIDYQYPFIDSSNHIFAWKSGIGTRNQLVQLSPNTSIGKNTKKPQKHANLKEKRLIFTLNSDSSPFNQGCTIGQGCAVWLETYQDQYKYGETTTEIDSEHYNLIRLQHYDFKTKKTTNLIDKCRYNTVALSPSTKQLIVVESDKNCKQHLVILDTKSGIVIKRMHNLDHGSYLTPNWVDEENIVVIQVKNQKNCILRINTKTEKVETLLPASYEHRNTPKIYKDFLLYNSSYNGIDNIYAMHLPTKACFQITSRKYGAYLGVVDPKTNQLFFCDYTKNGMDIAVMPFDPSLWIPLEQVEDRSLHYYMPLLKKSPNALISKIPNHTYTITTNHFIQKNLHWKPAYLENHKYNKYNNRNLLSCLTLFELYNIPKYFWLKPYILYKHKTIQNQQAHKIKLGTHFKYHTIHYIIEIHTQTKRSFQPYSPWYGKHTVNLTIPHYFTLNSSYGTFSWHAGVDFIPIKQKMYQTLGLKVENQSTKSTRDLCPPWQQYFGYQVKRMIQDYNLLKTKKQVTIHLSFPGIAPHHTFKIQAILDKTHYKHMIEVYSITSNNCFNTFERKTDQVFTTHLNYIFPLLYPDLDIFNLGLFKNINMQNFLALTWARNAHYTKAYPRIHTGIELEFITLLLPFAAFHLKFTYKVRLHWVKETNQPWQFIFEKFPYIE